VAVVVVVVVVVVAAVRQGTEAGIAVMGGVTTTVGA
jgi:hypothetical protein